MIGNDIVDLKKASRESNWRRRGFLDKVFSPTEQKFIEEASDKNKVVWLLWSMKEAAYKAHQRRFSLPRKLDWISLQCKVDKTSASAASGVVIIGSNCYFTSSRTNSEVIFTSAKAVENDFCKDRFKKETSIILKQLFMMEVSQYLKLPSKKLSIEKNEQQVPFVAYEKELVFGSFSFSSHGSYSAYSLSLTNC